MKNLFLTVAFTFATVFTFASNEELKSEVIDDCWTETLILSCGGEVPIYECGDGSAHYQSMVNAEEFFCDFSDNHINNL